MNLKSALTSSFCRRIYVSLTSHCLRIGSYQSATCSYTFECISSVKSSQQPSQILYCWNFISVFRRGMKLRKQMQAIRAWSRKWKDLSCVGWQLQGQEEGKLKTDVKNLARGKSVLWMLYKTEEFSLKYSARVSCRLSSGFQHASGLYSISYAFIFSLFSWQSRDCLSCNLFGIH